MFHLNLFHFFVSLYGFQVGNSNSATSFGLFFSKDETKMSGLSILYEYFNPFLFKLITLVGKRCFPRAARRPMESGGGEGAQSDVPRVGRNQRAKKWKNSTAPREEEIFVKPKTVKIRDNSPQRYHRRLLSFQCESKLKI